MVTCHTRTATPPDMDVEQVAFSPHRAARFPAHVVDLAGNNAARWPDRV